MEKQWDRVVGEKPRQAQTKQEPGCVYVVEKSRNLLFEASSGHMQRPVGIGPSECPLLSLYPAPAVPRPPRIGTFNTEPHRAGPG